MIFCHWTYKGAFVCRLEQTLEININFYWMIIVWKKKNWLEYRVFLWISTATLWLTFDCLTRTGVTFENICTWVYVSITVLYYNTCVCVSIHWNSCGNVETLQPGVSSMNACFTLWMLKHTHTHEQLLLNMFFF